jgi:hypothetical protein
MATRRKLPKSTARRSTPVPTTHGVARARGSAPTPALQATPHEKLVDAALRKAHAADQRRREVRAARSKASVLAAPRGRTWAEAAAEAKRSKPSKPARSKASVLAPTRGGGPWIEPSPVRTWAEAVAESHAQLARAKADKRAADRGLARAKREQARCDAAVERARRELADKTGRKAKARGEKKLAEQLARAQERLTRIEHETPGTIEQYRAITQWFELVMPGAANVEARDPRLR